jgi:hypothetical protein
MEFGGKKPMQLTVRRENRVSYKAKGLALVAGALLIGASMASSASAATLRRGSTGSGGADITAGGPGEVLWTWYETSEGSFSDHHFGNGDNIIRLVNPVGSATSATTGLSTSNACAMIYVFDDDEEMIECCGCPITPAQMATISVEDDLTDNPGITGSEGLDTDNGAIAIIATAPNAQITSILDANPETGCNFSSGAGAACHGGCDPSQTPGFSVTGAKNLLGSITHNQIVTGSGFFGTTTTSGLTEVALFDDAGGDPQNITYLQTACTFLAQGSSGGGVCSCPEE